VIPVTRQPNPWRRASGYPFAPGEQRRPLRLLLDDDSLTREDVSELLAFSHYDEVELVHTAQDALPRLEHQDATDEDFVPIRHIGDGASLFWVSNAKRIRERARTMAVQEDLGEEVVYRGLVFAEASEEMDADGFVTSRPYLLQVGPDFSGYTPAEAMALVGLALRVHGNRSIGSDLTDLSLGGSTFHFILGRELTYEGWRWFSACVAHSLAIKDDKAINLGQTALERLQRVLQIRDRMHASAKIPSSETTADEVVFQFETLLLFLSAAFDATARVAHLVYLGPDYKEAGWRRSGWHERLTQAEPELASLVADGTEGGTVLRLISRLRNSIHGEALRPLTTQRGGARPEHPAEFPEGLAARTIGDIQFLGEDPVDWGLRVDRTRTYLTADRFAESLLPHALLLLNGLMAQTRVERLSGVKAHELKKPPEDAPSARWWDDMFSWEIRGRVRRLGGF